MSFKYVIGVSGTPGAGKSTFCKTIRKYLLEMKRKVKVFNLDPGCEINLAYKPDWNITDFIKVSDVMKELELGPNGGLMEAMDTFFEEYDHVSREIEKSEEGSFFILDMPGQVELYTHRSPVKNFYKRLVGMKIAVCNVYMFDSTVLLTPDFFIAYSTNVTMSMLHLGVPAVNLLTKVDVLYNAEQAGKLEFPFQDYVASDFSTLGTRLTHRGYGFPGEKKYRKLTQLLAETNESYGLVHYLPFTAADDRFMGYVLFEIERAIGYIYPRGTPGDGGGLIATTSNSERELAEYVDAFMERCAKKTRKIRKPGK